MRLAVIRQHYAPDGAVEQVIESAFEALLERNVAISLYTRAWPATRLQLIEPVLCNPPHVGTFWRDIGFARVVNAAIGSAGADLVESHEPLACCDVYRADEGLHAVRYEERRKSASAWERLRLGLSPHERYLLAAEQRMFASPWLRTVICGSNMVREEIRERFGLPEAKLPVICPPVDSDAFSPAVGAHRGAFRERHGIGDAACVFVVAGAEFDGSGATAAIAALGSLPAPAHLVVATRHADSARVGALAQVHGAGERVTLTEPGNDLRPLLGAADAFVLPATYDPWPLAAFEAMACGLPMVVGTKSGAAEHVVAHDAGFVCPTGDAPALVAAMRNLLDVSTRASLGANARNAVRPFSPGAIALQLVLLYRDLFAATGSRR